MNPFSQPKNYNEMLTKIMTFTFCISLAFVALVANCSPAVWSLLHPGWLTFDVDVLGIRESFDLHEILNPLAGGVGVPIDLTMRGRLIEHRGEIMGRIFCRYA